MISPDMGCLCCRNKSPLTQQGVGAGLMPDFACGNFQRIGLEIPQHCRFNEFEGIFFNWCDAGLLQCFLGTCADLGNQNGMAIFQGAQRFGENIFVVIATLAVKVDPAMTDKFGPPGRNLVYLKFAGMAKMLIDFALTLGGHCQQNGQGVVDAWKTGELFHGAVRTLLLRLLEFFKVCAVNGCVVPADTLALDGDTAIEASGPAMMLTLAVPEIELSVAVTRRPAVAVVCAV